MSSWEPKVIGNPIDKLIASQMDEEEYCKSETTSTTTVSSSLSTVSTTLSSDSSQSSSAVNSVTNGSTNNLTGKSVLLTKQEKNLEDSVVKQNKNIDSLSQRNLNATNSTTSSNTKAADKITEAASKITLKPSSTPFSDSKKDADEQQNVNDISDTNSRIISNLWKIPDRGTFRNPYFGGVKEVDSINVNKKLITVKEDKKEKPTVKSKDVKKSNIIGNSNQTNIVNNNTSSARKDSVNIPFIEVDDDVETDSVNESTTTDESEDQLPLSPRSENIASDNSSNQSKKVIEPEKLTTTKIEPSPTSKPNQNSVATMNGSTSKEIHDKYVEKIPGLGSPIRIDDDNQENTPNEPQQESKVSGDSKFHIKQETAQKNNDNACSFIKTDIKDEKKLQLSSPSEIVKPESVGTSQSFSDTKTFKKEEPIELNIEMNGKIDDLSMPKCIRIGCTNEAIDDPEWDNEFCSAKCCVQHCKTAFANWVKSRQNE